MRAALAVFLCAALAGADKPRLLVVVSVDQMRPDTLSRFAKEYTGGLKRIVERGLHFRGVIDHGATQTGPGHSTMLTGCRPAKTGIVANNWFDRRSLAAVYCVEDGSSPVYGRPDRGRSPRNLLRDTLGDWMKRADPRSRVYAVSGKDRSAVLMGGLRPDGAYWLEKRAGGFSTSSYYHPAGLPDWLRAFNAGDWVKKLPEHWTYEPVSWLRADDDPRESPLLSRTSPHPLREGSLGHTLDRVYRSPHVDEWTLLLARQIVERFDLGGDEACDLLCVGLSATDTVGHLYGPFSQEIRDTTLRLDRELGALFDFLDRRNVPFVLALTADHGVLPFDRMRRIHARLTQQTVAVALQKRFGSSDLFRRTGMQFWIDRAKVKRKGLDVATVRAVLKEVLLSLDVIAEVHDRPALLGEGGSALRVLARKSFHRERSGDLIVHAKENVLFDTYGTGTSHGSPYRYDRDVPVVFLGAGIASGRRDREARTIDIAPTLARLIGVALPDDLDGTALAVR